MKYFQILPNNFSYDANQMLTSAYHDFYDFLYSVWTLGLVPVYDAHDLKTCVLVDFDSLVQLSKENDSLYLIQDAVLESFSPQELYITSYGIFDRLGNLVLDFSTTIQKVGIYPLHLKYEDHSLSFTFTYVHPDIDEVISSHWDTFPIRVDWVNPIDRYLNINAYSCKTLPVVTKFKPAITTALGDFLEAQWRQISKHPFISYCNSPLLAMEERQRAHESFISNFNKYISTLGGDY